MAMPPSIMVFCNILLLDPTVSSTKYTTVESPLRVSSWWKFYMGFRLRSRHLRVYGNTVHEEYMLLQINL